MFDEQEIKKHKKECDARRKLIKEGEWSKEEDRVQWEHKGFDCLIIRNPLSFVLCGYVGVPKTHSYFKKSYSDIDEISVHGGLTYANECMGHICHNPNTGLHDSVWWLGFDCAHGYDISPGFDFIMPDAKYRNIAYLKKEVNELAEQLEAV